MDETSTLSQLEALAEVLGVQIRYEYLETDDFFGVTGKISFDLKGEVEKDPVLLTIYGRNLHPLN